MVQVIFLVKNPLADAHLLLGPLAGAELKSGSPHGIDVVEFMNTELAGSYWKATWLSAATIASRLGTVLAILQHTPCGLAPVPANHGGHDALQEGLQHLVTKVNKWN